MDRTTSFEDLKKKYKDDSSYKDDPEMGHVGLDPDDLFTTHEDLMTTAIKPLEFVLHPILPKAGYVLFHAEAGVGKTYFCLNLAYAIAKGGNFLKYAAPHPKKVLYIDAELGEQSIRRRIDKIAEKQGKMEEKNLDYLFFDKFPNGEMPKIDTAAGRKFYTDHILKHGYEGVFLDNLMNLSTSDFNKATDWYPIQQWILALRQKGIFFFLLHHAGSDSTKQLGTSARIIIAHTVISLRKNEDDDKEGVLKVSYQKCRDMSKEESRPFIAINNFDGTWAREDIEPDLEKEIIYYSQKGLKPLQIAKVFKDDGMKIHHSKVYRIVDKLKSSGRIS